MTTPLFRGSDVFVVTVGYSPTDESDSIGDPGDTLLFCKVYASYDDALVAAREEIKNYDLHEDIENDDEEAFEDESDYTDYDRPRGCFEKKPGALWVIHNDYEVTYVEIHALVIQ